MDGGSPQQSNHISTLNEKPLHAGLKEWYARPGDRIEVPVDGFLIDIEKHTMARFGSGNGTVEFQVCD